MAELLDQKYNKNSNSVKYSLMDSLNIKLKKNAFEIEKFVMYEALSANNV